MSKLKILIKKIGKYSLLLSVKESYLFIKNLLGLIYHPFKTLRQILREQDLSQAALIFGLPVYTFVAGVIFIFIARFLIQAPPEWGILLKLSLFLIFLTSFLIFVYLLYWLLKLWRFKHESEKI
jgi:hypothetical protein